MILKFQLTLSLVYAVGAILTLYWLHTITSGKYDEEFVELRIMKREGIVTIYVIWAFLAFLWPATWIHLLVTERKLSEPMRARCVRKSHPRCGYMLHSGLVDNLCDRYVHDRCIVHQRYDRCIVHQRSRACRCLRCTRNFPLPERNELGEWESKEEYEMRTGLKLPGSRSSDEQ